MTPRGSLRPDTAHTSPNVLVRTMTVDDRPAVERLLRQLNEVEEAFTDGLSEPAANATCWIFCAAGPVPT
jgi:hypothetical protein